HPLEPLQPFDCRGRTHTKPTGRRTATFVAALDRRNHPLTQILGIGSRHSGWPPPPARIVNHISVASVKKNDSSYSQNTLTLAWGAETGTAQIKKSFLL